MDFEKACQIVRGAQGSDHTSKLNAEDWMSLQQAQSILAGEYIKVLDAGRIGPC